MTGKERLALIFNEDEEEKNEPVSTDKRGEHDP
jgi:hypothetical protein